VKISSEQVLIVRTHEISKRVHQIADFAGVSESSICPGKSHSFKAAAKHNLLAGIPPDFLEAKVNTHCRILMNQFFPEVKTAHDVL